MNGKSEKSGRCVKMETIAEDAKKGYSVWFDDTVQVQRFLKDNEASTVRP